MTEFPPTPYLIDAATRRFPLTGATTALGRSPHCEIYVPDRRASRRHAQIDWDGERAILTDLESTNGTSLNGRRVTGPEQLRDGDEILIGSAAFTFRDPAATLRVDELPLVVVDATSGDMWVNRQPVSLSPKERALFDLLHSSPGRICSKQEIAETVWPEYQAEVYDYQVESLVKRLREKLEPDPRSPVLVLTERGRGYRLAGSI